MLRREIIESIIMICTYISTQNGIGLTPECVVLSVDEAVGAVEACLSAFVVPNRSVGLP